MTDYLEGTMTESDLAKLTTTMTQLITDHIVAAAYRHMEARDKEFAAVPLKTKNASQSVSKRSRIFRMARFVQSSSP